MQQAALLLRAVLIDLQQVDLEACSPSELRDAIEIIEYAHRQWRRLQALSRMLHEP